MGRPGIALCRTNTGRAVTATGLGSTIAINRYSDLVTSPTSVGTIADLDSGFVGNPNLSDITIRRSQVIDCVWGSPGGAIRLASSSDRGRTFGAAVAIQASGYQNPSVDWDPGRERLYVALQDTPGLDWYLSYADLDSSGGLGAWSTPILIVAAASDEVACLRVRADGKLGFAWSDGGAVRFQLSEDQGASWGSPITVIAAGFRNPTFCFDPGRQRIVMAIQSTSAQSLGGFNTLSWFLAVSQLDADGHPSAFVPGAYDPTVTIVNFVTTVLDPAVINWGWATQAGACIRCDPHGQISFAHLDAGASPIARIARSARVPNTGLARGTWIF